MEIKSEYTVLGLMSGTSLDGLDMALCHFHLTDGAWQYKVLAAETHTYPVKLRECLAEATELSAYDFVRLDVELAEVMAEYINLFLDTQSVKPDFIASHGHTTFHQPAIGLTSQIGNGAVLAARTGITIVCDFRTLDVANGGQGAPLVPIGDELLFGSYDACLNLGGFSNISFRENYHRVAFDVSPCNMALNYLANQLEMPFDRDGATARTGLIVNDLLVKLNALDFYNIKGAKSLGKEWFDSEFRLCLDGSKASVEDKLRTVTEHIALQIAMASKGQSGETMLVTGGGARNKFLIERIQTLGSKTIIVPDDETVDFKEAIIFAFLGVLRMRGETNCLRDVTGAKTDSCGGAIYLGKK